ncbi:hypothetical protein [Rhodopirellula europaea]|uniref:hypothetical protein n=1 Tax=Rhodopirellula europaea TaxID=1263866 RepID=UPI001564DAEE|nr:hypothetical protein [Rhodopirellula europaea]
MLRFNSSCQCTFALCVAVFATAMTPANSLAQTARLRPQRLPLVQPESPASPPTTIAVDTADDLPPSPFPERQDFNYAGHANVALGSPSFADHSILEEESAADFAKSAGLENLSHFANDFSPTPLPQESNWHDGSREQWVYDAKAAVPTQSPWIEWGRTFYGPGITPRGKNWFGSTNLARPEFYLYGDFRSGIITGRNAAGRTDNWASRLNLDLDLRLTDSERFHGFIGPLDRNGQFNRVDFQDGKFDYQGVFDPNFVTAFFEGDLGAMWGGFHGKSSPAEMPVTIGLIPLLFQNGIWMEDAVTGAAFAIPARHSRALNWANFDWTFFAAIDQVNSNAFGTDKHAAQAFGTACFIEAYGGYIEAGYAFLRDRNDSRRSYHNMTVSFTKRYLDRISNSLRLIINTGQNLPDADVTADGGLFLWENSLITSSPLTVVPYANFFYGWGRPQSVARAGGSGGVLRNTGINFDTDGLNGFATLDPTGFDTVGGSIGIDLIGNQLDRQLLLEASYLTEHGDSNPFVQGDQFGLGTRYQFPVSNRTLLRFDVMHGWRSDLPNVYGTRMEYRWKF